jgi:hypothetical protein
MEPITEQELRAFVGPNSDYYLNKWWPGLKGHGAGYDQVAAAGLMLAQPKTGFNWAAFFLTGLWLPYRKMYVPALILFGVILVKSLFAKVYFVGILGQPGAPYLLSWLVGLIAGIVCGSLGNRWYLSRARKVIAEVRSRGLPEVEHLREVSRRGGTSVLAALGFFAVFVVALLGLIIAVKALFGVG